MEAAADEEHGTASGNGKGPAVESNAETQQAPRVEEKRDIDMGGESEAEADGVPAGPGTGTGTADEEESLDAGQITQQQQQQLQHTPQPGSGYESYESGSGGAGQKRKAKERSKEKKWICDEPGCGKAFERRHDLQRHVWVHGKVQPHVCPTCNRQFVREDLLNKHVCTSEPGDPSTVKARKRRGSNAEAAATGTGAAAAPQRGRKSRLSAGGYPPFDPSAVAYPPWPMPYLDPYMASAYAQAGLPLPPGVSVADPGAAGAAAAMAGGAPGMPGPEMSPLYGQNAAATAAAAAPPMSAVPAGGESASAAPAVPVPVPVPAGEAAPVAAMEPAPIEPPSDDVPIPDGLDPDADVATNPEALLARIRELRTKLAKYKDSTTQLTAQLNQARSDSASWAQAAAFFHSQLYAAAAHMGQMGLLPPPPQQQQQQQAVPGSGTNSPPTYPGSAAGSAQKMRTAQFPSQQVGSAPGSATRGRGGGPGRGRGRKPKHVDSDSDDELEDSESLSRPGSEEPVDSGKRRGNFIRGKGSRLARMSAQLAAEKEEQARNKSQSSAARAQRAAQRAAENSDDEDEEEDEEEEESSEGEDGVPQTRRPVVAAAGANKRATPLPPAAKQQPAKTARALSTGSSSTAPKMQPRPLQAPRVRQSLAHKGWVGKKVGTFPARVPAVEWKGNPMDIPPESPGYNRLHPVELQVCSILRMLPEQYLHVKDVIVIRPRRSGFIRKQDAKKHCKMDVNKVGKIYDWFVALEWIPPPEDEGRGAGYSAPTKFLPPAPAKRAAPDSMDEDDEDDDDEEEEEQYGSADFGEEEEEEMDEGQVGMLLHHHPHDHMQEEMRPESPESPGQEGAPEYSEEEILEGYRDADVESAGGMV